MAKKIIPFIITFLLSGCLGQGKIDACHLKVNQAAKHTADIITTETKRKGLEYYNVNGLVKLQNGFGAWSNHKYNCTFAGDNISDFTLNKGW